MNCFATNSRTLLFEVFSSLGKSHKIIQDDTQLEKLHSCMENFVNDQKSAALFLSHPEVMTFFQYAASGVQERTYQALILGLRLGPHLYITSSSTYPDVLCAGDGCASSAVPLWLEAMFQMAIETECAWSEGSVRNAWVLGLASICSVPDGLHWALKRGYLTHVVLSIFDSSIFVSNQAQLLTITLLPELLLGSFPAHVCNPVCDLSKGVWEALTVLIRKYLIHTGYDTTRVTSVLTMVRGICKVAPAHVRGRLSLADDLWQFAKKAQVWDNRSLAHQVVTALVEIVELSDERTTAQERVEAFALYLLGDHIISAMSLSSQLLSRGGCIHADRLTDVVMLPVKLLLADPIHNLDVTLVQTAKQALHEKTLAGKALLSSVHRLFPLTGDGKATMAAMLARLLDATLHYDVTTASIGGVIGLRQAAYLNWKLQLALVDGFIKFSQSDHSSEAGYLPDEQVMITVFKHCLVLLKQPGIPATVSTKAVMCLGVILDAMEEAGHEWPGDGRAPPLSPGGDVPGAGRVTREAGPLEDFAELLLQGVCDIRWEVRDTAVTTLGSIIGQAKPGGVVVTWLERHRLVQQVWQSVSDGESYVRAGAVTALTNLPRHPPLWNQLLAFCSQENVLAKLLAILAEDTEAFARRSAVSLLCRWLQTGAMPGHTATIQAALNVSANDLDWEVKLSVLGYWEDVIQKEIASFKDSIMVPPLYVTPLPAVKHTLKETPQVALHKHLERLNQGGCLRCLLTVATDHDRSVQHKACQILVILRDICTTHSLSPTSKSTDDQEGTSAKKRRLQSGVSDKDEDMLTVTGEVHTGIAGSGPLPIEQFLEELNQRRIDQLLLESSESIDDYVRNPESLFQDILTSLAKEDEENAIDCY